MIEKCEAPEIANGQQQQQQQVLFDWPPTLRCVEIAKIKPIFLLLLILLVNFTAATGNGLAQIIDGSLKLTTGPHVYQKALHVSSKQYNQIDNNFQNQRLNTVARQVLETIEPEDENERLDVSNLADSSDSHLLPILRTVWYGAKNAIAPTSTYISLVGRYRRWFKEYNELKRAAVVGHGKELRDANDLLRVEFAKVDKQLIRDKCKAFKNDGDDDDDDDGARRLANEKKAENIDFILDALKLLIGRLEDRLHDIRRYGFTGDLLRSDANENDGQIRDRLDQDKYMKIAMGRAKRIALKKTSELVANESKHLIKVCLFKSLANALKNREKVGPYESVLSLIEPIAMLIAHLDTPIIVQYLRSLRYRVSLGIVKYISAETLAGCKLA